MKGLTRLVGLRDLDSLLHPKPKKWKKKKRPMQQQYNARPVYQSSYNYPQPSYDPAPAYAPPPAYDPAPEYAPPPAYDPAPANTPPAEPPSYAPPQDSAPTPQPAPVDAPTAEPAPVLPPVIAQVDVLPPPYAPPAQYYPTNNVPPHASRGIQESPIQTAQQWNEPSVSSSQSDSLPPQISDSAPVVDSTSVVPPPTYISIQTNGFLPIFPSPVDPLPFEPSPANNQTPQMPDYTGNVPTFGVAPSPLPPPPSAPSPPLPSPAAPSLPLPPPSVPYLPRLPPRGSRLDDSQPLDQSLSVTEDSSSQSTATSASTSAATSATPSVVTPIAVEHLEMDETEGPQYSIMDESTPTDTSVTNSSMPYGQPLNSAYKIATL